MTIGAVGLLLAIFKFLGIAVPLLALWFAKRAGRKEILGEQAATNAKLRKKWEKIEQEDRSSGKWL